jgi:hypothetical protein
MPHLSDARGAKSPFQLTTILMFVKQIATSTVAKDLKPGSSAWEAIGTSISHLIEEGSKLFPLAMEPESVLKGSSLLHVYTFDSLLMAALTSVWYSSLGNKDHRNQSDACY